MKKESRMSLGPGSMILWNSHDRTSPMIQGNHFAIPNNTQNSNQKEQNVAASHSRSILEHRGHGRFYKPKIILENYNPTFEKEVSPKTEREALKSFLAGITKPNPRRGYLNCRLCNDLIWGPNGKNPDAYRNTKRLLISVHTDY